MSLIAGRAEAGPTAAFLSRHAEAAPRRFGALALSSVGIGTYLGDANETVDEQYQEAIAHALDAGLNVIDTAVSYRNQRSERVIGAALAEAIAAGRLARSEVFVASKAGYVPNDGQRPRHYPTYVEETYIRTGILKREELVGGVHCMAPRYLDDQIARSRNNLGLATIDVYYLHNPESGMEGVAPALFRRRLAEAFATLEAAARDGRIGAYGVATWNGLRKPPGQSPHQSLSELVEIAEEAGGADHHFKVVQAPYNLGLIEAFASPTQELGDRRVPLVEAAAARGLYLMASASLLQGQLVERLPDHLRATLGAGTDAERAVQFVRSTPGIGTALVGMKRAAHVDEIARVTKTPPLAPETIREIFSEDERR